MTKSQLAENIIKTIEKSEWQQLQEGTLPVPVSEHNRTVLSCLVLTFLKEEPMHLKDKVQYRVVDHDGIKEYSCPAKTDRVICNYCVAKKMEI